MCLILKEKHTTEETVTICKIKKNNEQNVCQS